MGDVIPFGKYRCHRAKIEHADSVVIFPTDEQIIDVTRFKGRLLVATTGGDYELDERGRPKKIEIVPVETT